MRGEKEQIFIAVVGGGGGEGGGGLKAGMGQISSRQ